MKKFLLIVSFVLLSLLPAFSAAWEIQQARHEYTQGAYSKCLNTLNTAIANSSYKDSEMYRLRGLVYMKLNSPVSAIKDFDVVIELNPSVEIYEKRAYTHLKIRDYNNALMDFCKTIDKSNKGELAVKGFKIIANDSNIPIDVRWDAYDYLSKFNQGRYGKGSAEHVIPMCKMLQLVVNLNENDKIFENKSKKELIEEARANFANRQNKSEDFDVNMGAEIALGYFEYAIGNKESGKKIVYGVINELKARDPNGDWAEFEQDAIKIFKALDTPGI